MSKGGKSSERAYARLTRHERQTIERMLDRGKGCREIAVELDRDTVNVFFTNRANGSAPSAQMHFHQSRKRAFAASG